MAATNTSPDTSSPTRAQDEPSSVVEERAEQAETQKEVQKDTQDPQSSQEATATQGQPEASDMLSSAEAPATSTSGADPATTSPATAEVRSLSPRALRKQPEALGPASDAAIATPIAPSTGLTLNISLMLTTGARHPYKVDEKYIRNRGVTAVDAEGNFDPRELSGYQLKELVWTDWRAEWEPRPASPSSIRLIILGRMIDDKAALKEYPFNLANINVVHMTVKPADLLEDDETAGKASKTSILRVREGEDRGAGCRCVIQ